MRNEEWLAFGNRKKKKKQRRFGKLTVEINSRLTEDSIGKEWNLEDWNDKIQTYRTEMKNGET